IGKREVAMIVSIFAIGTTPFLNWVLPLRLRWVHRGLAFSTSIVATINFLLLYALMWRQTRGLESRRLFAGLAKICLAGLLLALICWLANYWWLEGWEHLRFFEKLFGLFATILVSAAAFFGFTFLLRVDEVRNVFDLVKRRLRRGGV